jgi:hypothetical protein
VPPLEQMDRHQYAVYWEALGTDSYGQSKVSDDPVELRVRWNFKRTQTVSANGTPVALDGTVVADRELVADSLLWAGRLRDLPAGTSFSEEDDELYVVTTVTVTKDIKGRNTRYEFGVARFRSTLPAQQTPE